ncbi:hypothetical protein ACT691_16170 [Vibrio metschnikovii]
MPSAQNHNLERVLDRQLIQLAKPALEQGLAVNARTADHQYRSQYWHHAVERNL